MFSSLSACSVCLVFIYSLSLWTLVVKIFCLKTLVKHGQCSLKLKVISPACVVLWHCLVPYNMLYISACGEGAGASRQVMVHSFLLVVHTLDIVTVDMVRVYDGLVQLCVSCLYLEILQYDLSFFLQLNVLGFSATSRKQNYSALIILWFLGNGTEHGWKDDRPSRSLYHCAHVRAGSLLH